MQVDWPELDWLAYIILDFRKNSSPKGGPGP